MSPTAKTKTNNQGKSRILLKNPKFIQADQRYLTKHVLVYFQGPYKSPWSRFKKVSGVERASYVKGMLFVG